MFKTCAARERGFTLLEVMIAVAIFAVVVGVTATSLASFYLSMDIQEQRIEAVHAGQAVLDAIRDKRGEFQLADDQYDWTALFTWIDNQDDEGWPGFVREGMGHEELREHTISVEVRNMDGGVAQPGDNPVQMRAVSSWRDRRGHPMQVDIITVMTNR